MISDTVASIHHRGMKESDIKSDLLILLMTKPIEFRTEMPDWPHCAHVDLVPSDDWLEERSLRVLLNQLVGYLAHTGCMPIDLCAVKMPDVYSIVVKTTEPSITIAA